jgi:hypothetical protein
VKCEGSPFIDKKMCEGQMADVTLTFDEVTPKTLGSFLPKSFHPKKFKFLGQIVLKLISVF